MYSACHEEHPELSHCHLAGCGVTGTGSEPWELGCCYHESGGQSLQVELKSGNTIKGKLSSASESGLTLMHGRSMENVERSEVRRIYREEGKSVGKSTLIGAGVGGAGGAIVGAATGGDRKGIVSFSRKETAALVGVLGAAVGAVTGLVIGLAHHKKTLIYEE